jgi:diguanylate cyclase (GGDEF)-like protein
MSIVLALLFAVATLVTAWLATINWRRRQGSLYIGAIAVMGAGVAVINSLNAVHALMPYPIGVWVIISIQAVIGPAVISLVVCMALLMSDRAWRPNRRLVTLLSIVPVVTLIGAATNPWHHLVFSTVTPIGVDGILLPNVAPRPLLVMNLVYIQALLIGTVVRVLLIRRRATSHTQRRNCLLVLGCYLPTIPFAILMGTLPTPVVDLMPLGQALTMVYIQVMLIGTMPQHIPVAHRQVFATINDAVTVIDNDGRIIEVNPAADGLLHRLAPVLPEDLTGFQLSDLFHLTLDSGSVTEHTLPDVWGSGVDLHLLINPLYDKRGCIGWALVARDITEANRRRREAEEAATQLREQLATIQALQAHLAEQATRDVLTGLHNRRYLMETLERDIPRLQHASMACLAIIDLDYFKQINDTYGHGGGDAVLVKVGELLSRAVRGGDVVARYGGEEFVVVMHGAGADAACARLEDLRNLVKGTVIEADGHLLSVSFSAGVAEYLPGRTSEDMLRLADEALYEAKRLGRDRVERASSVPALSRGGSGTTPAPDAC